MLCERCQVAKRGCLWMSGPQDGVVHMPARKWWFAISRDMFAKSQRSQMRLHRPPVACHMTPTFSRPLAEHKQR